MTPGSPATAPATATATAWAWAAAEIGDTMREKDVCHHCGADKRDMARLTRERDEARDHRDLATEQLLMVGSEIGGDPKLDPKDHRDPRWTPTLEEAAKLRTDNERMRGALEEATRALTVDPPYLSPARVGTARSILAAALAGECGRTDQ